jgi:2-iminoacetate synthase
MAQQAIELTRRRFGHDINLFIPMYLSNLCANKLDYCGFIMSNKIRRKILNALLLGHHLAYLENHYWRSKYSLSLPSLRPCTGKIEPKLPISDKGLVQVTCVFRLFNEQLEISLSTRESERFRDNFLPMGVTHMSAERSTQPFGYAGPARQLAQFEISDERVVMQITEAIENRGYTTVFKDWQAD